MATFEIDLPKHVLYHPSYKKYADRARRLAAYIHVAMPLILKFNILNLADADKITFRIAPIKSKQTQGRCQYIGWYANPHTGDVIRPDRRHFIVHLDMRQASTEVFAHELVHVEQFLAQRLSYEYNLVDRRWINVWNSNVCMNKGTTYRAYRSQPWEVEAFGRQAGIVAQIFAAGNTSERQVLGFRF